LIVFTVLARRLIREWKEIEGTLHVNISRRGHGTAFGADDPVPAYQHNRGNGIYWTSDTGVRVHREEHCKSGHTLNVRLVLPFKALKFINSKRWCKVCGAPNIPRDNFDANNPDEP
jgi:hypothetical protein